VRLAFIAALAELAARDDRIVLLTADLGFRAIEAFRDCHPDRFFNVGVAEQNMIGMATGLAEAGLLPFVYSIAPFVMLRGYEFLRHGPVLHGLPVRLVGIGAGVEYGSNGMTHYALEDIAVARVQPGLSILAPADSAQAGSVLRATWDRPGPVYYRLGKDDATAMPGLDGRFEPGRLAITREGDGPLLLTTSSAGPLAAVAADRLAALGFAPILAVVAELKPLPLDDLMLRLSRTPLVATIENHYPDGGLGSLVAELVAERGLGCRLRRFGLRFVPDGRSGSAAYLNRALGLDPEAIAGEIEAALRAGR
jgi:transketolase